MCLLLNKMNEGMNMEGQRNLHIELILYKTLSNLWESVSDSLIGVGVRSVNFFLLAQTAVTESWRSGSLTAYIMSKCLPLNSCSSPDNSKNFLDGRGTSKRGNVSINHVSGATWAVTRVDTTATFLLLLLLLRSVGGAGDKSVRRRMLAMHLSWIFVNV